MGLFSRGREGGIMDTIRCDEQNFLIWKWRPSGDANSTHKENSIRWGSSLRVKENEIAVFVYKQKEGQKYDFIEGPHDEIIKTVNFPIITNIIGLAYDGDSPFQAEIYFINLAGNIQLRFGVPYFDVFDPRFLDFGVPISVRGTVTFNIEDPEGFIKLNRLINFEIDDLKHQVSDAITKHLKSILTNLPESEGIPVLQIERKILDVNQIAEENLRERLLNDFGINLKGLDIGAIEVDKESLGYKDLREITATQAKQTVQAQTDAKAKDIADNQRINIENAEEILKINREEGQRIQKLKTEGENFSVHQLNQQTEVGKAAAESLGKSGGSGGSSMDPGSMMASMAIGGAIGGNMAGTIGGMMNGMNQSTPPPPPITRYYIANNGEQKGPFNIDELKNLVASGEVKSNTHLWKQGMSEWKILSEMEELKTVLEHIPPPPPVK